MGEKFWPVFALGAAAAAANGDIVAARMLLARAESEAAASGDNPLPDLLVPAAALAWATDHTDAARRWLTAIRHAPTPTQGFYITIVYRQLRQEVGLVDRDPLEHATLDDIYQEASAWMATPHVPA
jgi:hypothetical protein